MSSISRITVALLFSTASFTTAASPTTNPQEARLIGAWQEGLTPKLAQGSPEQATTARKAGLLGAITVFKADHRFELHLPCGAKQAELRKLGMQFIPGTWQLSKSGDLILTVTNGKRQAVEQGKLHLSEGQMTWTGKNGRVLQKAGKYEGPLPLVC